MTTYSIPNPLLKLSPMAVPAVITVSAPPLTVTASEQRKSIASKISAKDKKILSPTSPSTLSSSNVVATSSSSSTPLKKVLVPIVFGTEEMEAVIIVDVLRQARAAVTVAAVEPELEIEASGDDGQLKNFRSIKWLESCSITPRVLIPIANGSQGIELATIGDILRRAKVDVVIASVEKSCQILTSTRAKVVADKLIKEAAESIYDLIILPGGAAADERLSISQILKKILKEQDSAKRIYGAVCSSPAVQFN